MKRGFALRTTAVIAAAAALCNPSPMYFDILPDVFGFLFLYFAFRRLAELVPAFADAREAGNKMLLITALKIPVWVVMMTVWGGDARQRALIAVVCFASAILELCYLIPWINRLFEAFYLLGEQYDCVSAIAASGRRFRMAPEKLKALTIVFFSARAALSCLPEMALVPVYDSAEEYTLNWNRLYLPLAVAASVVVLAFGVIWLCYFAAYVRRVGRETAECEALAALDAVTPCRYREPPARLRIASFLYLAGVILSVDIYADWVNYLPDVLSALAFAACGLYLWRVRVRGRVVWILPLVYGAATIVHTVLWTRFFGTYSIDAIERLADAARAYRVVLGAAAVCEALSLASAVALFVALLDVIRRFVGRPGADGHTFRTDLAARRALTRSLTVAFGLACLCAGLSFFYEISLSETVEVATDFSYLAVPRFGWSLLALWVATAAWLIASLHFFNRLKEEIGDEESA